jgi:hypothetical protein
MLTHSQARLVFLVLLIVTFALSLTGYHSYRLLLALIACLAVVEYRRP